MPLFILLAACSPKESPAPSPEDTAADTGTDTEDTDTAEDTDDTETDTPDTSPPDTAPVETNLLGNADFEDSTLGLWSVYPTTLMNYSVVTTSDVGFSAHSGGAALQLWGQDTGMENETPIYQAFTAAPGDTFTLSGYAWMPASNPFVATHTYAYLSIKYFGAAWTWLGSSESTKVSSTSPTDTWIPLSATGTAPAGTIEIQASLVLWQCSGVLTTCTDGTGTVYFDDVRLE